MADTVQLNVQGLDNLKRKLDQLSNPRKAKSIARKAARQAMNIVRDDARTRARMIDDPETAEKIFKNISVAGGKSRNPNEVVIRVGVRGGGAMNMHSNREKLAGLSGGNTTYFRYIEFGTAHVAATPFLRPALSQNIQAVTNRFVDVFNFEIDKEINSL